MVFPLSLSLPPHTSKKRRKYYSAVPLFREKGKGPWKEVYDDLERKKKERRKKEKRKKKERRKKEERRKRKKVYVEKIHAIGRFEAKVLSHNYVYLSRMTHT